MIVRCPGCRIEIPFDQPYAYHAGFGNQGSLYNEAGTLTLVWSVYDAAFMALGLSWERDARQRQAIEAALLPSPAGDRWLFGNPARCLSCGHSIRQSILQDIYFLKYPGSVLTEESDGGRGFASVMRPDYDPSQ